MRKFTVDPFVFSSDYKKDITAYRRMLDMARSEYGIIFNCKFETVIWEDKPVLTLRFNVN